MPVAPRHATKVPHLAKQAKVLAAERADIFSRRRAAGRCAPFLGRVGGSLHGGQEALGCALGGVAAPSRETAALGALREQIYMQVSAFALTFSSSMSQIGVPDHDLSHNESL